MPLNYHLLLFVRYYLFDYLSNGMTSAEAVIVVASCLRHVSILVLALKQEDSRRKRQPCWTSKAPSGTNYQQVPGAGERSQCG